jgi:hypothetical protein
MLSCEEFANQSIIEKCKVCQFFKLKKNNYLEMANIHQDNKKIIILTPEMKISPYNKFSLDEKYGKRNTIYLRITDDGGMQEFLNKIIVPLDNLFNTQEMIKLIFPNINNINMYKNYSPIIGKNNKIHFKIYNMKLTVIDADNNISDFIITENNINDINKYLTYQSKIKLILNIDKMWKSTASICHGVRIVCNHFLILNGTNISDDILDKYKITDDYDINNKSENEEEINI